MRRAYTSELIIICAGGLAQAVASHNALQFRIEAFMDKKKHKNETILGYPVIEEPLKDFMGRYVIVCGDTRRRRILAEKYSELAYATIKNYHCIVSPHSLINRGTVICPNVVVDPGVEIGEHSYIDHNTAIGHFAILGKYSHIAPLCMIGGSARIGDGTFIGANVVVLPHKKIGCGCLIGAGSVVTKDIPDNQVWAGTPAKQINRMEEW